MLKPTEEFFRFPIRKFDPVEEEYEKFLEDKRTQPPEREVKEYVVVTKVLQIESIEEYEETFAWGRTLDDIKEFGCDATLVSTKMEDYLCDWSIKKFEAEYNKHIEKLVNHTASLLEKHSEGSDETIAIINQLQKLNKSGE
jgi:hypothetical protein